MKDPRNEIYAMVGISAALHFLVDALCLCTLYLLSPYFEGFDLVGVFMTYNLFAFVTQIATGHLADITHHKHWQLIVSLLLLITGVTTMALTISTAPHSSATEMLPTAILLGLGNSLFHAWGGKQVAMNTHNDIRALGVFVSTGAFGLAVAYVTHTWAALYTILLSACVLAGWYIWLDGKAPPYSSWKEAGTGMRNVDEREEKDNSPLHFVAWVAGVAILALMLLVMLRSWIGESFSAVIGKSDATILAIGLIAMLGKMTGGWIARGIGIVRSMVAVLIVVLVCMMCRDSHLAIALVGLYAINCTMPVTLYLANEVMDRHEGLAFGLLAAALMPGYLIAIL